MDAFSILLFTRIFDQWWLSLRALGESLHIASPAANSTSLGPFFTFPIVKFVFNKCAREETLNDSFSFQRDAILPVFPFNKSSCPHSLIPSTRYKDVACGPARHSGIKKECLPLEVVSPCGFSIPSPRLDSCLNPENPLPTISVCVGVSPAYTFCLHGYRQGMTFSFSK